MYAYKHNPWMDTDNEVVRAEGGGGGGRCEQEKKYVKLKIKQ